MRGCNPIRLVRGSVHLVIGARSVATQYFLEVSNSLVQSLRDLNITLFLSVYDFSYLYLYLGYWTLVFVEK
jgi:hypothetical protein